MRCQRRSGSIPTLMNGEYWTCYCVLICLVFVSIGTVYHAAKVKNRKFTVIAGNSEFTQILRNTPSYWSTEVIATFRIRQVWQRGNGDMITRKIIRACTCSEYWHLIVRWALGEACSFYSLKFVIAVSPSSFNFANWNSVSILIYFLIIERDYNLHVS